MANRKTFKDVVDFVNLCSELKPSWSSLAKQATKERKVIALTEVKLYSLLKETYDYYAFENWNELARRVIFTGDKLTDKERVKSIFERFQNSILDSFSNSVKIASETESNISSTRSLKL